MRTPQYLASSESKIQEAYRLRRLLDSDDDDALRRADSKLLTSLTALSKKEPNDRVKTSKERLEAKMRTENAEVLKPSKFSDSTNMRNDQRELLVILMN